MGMDLYRGKDYFRCNTLAWHALLEAAMTYGWEPMGTGPCRGYLKKDWDGSCAYWGNDGQLFYARDAKNLATALEIFLTTPEAPQLRRTKRQREVLSAGRGVARFVQSLVNTFSKPTRKSKANQRNAPQRLTDDQRKYIKQFISYCRKGSFRIY